MKISADYTRNERIKTIRRLTNWDDKQNNVVQKKAFMKKINSIHPSNSFPLSKAKLSETYNDKFYIKESYNMTRILLIISVAWIIVASTLLATIIISYSTQTETSYKCYTCPSTYYYNRLTMSCYQKHLHTNSCSSTLECRDDLGLSCQNYLCLCNTLLQYWNGTKCINYKTYMDDCVYGTECRNSLQCASVNSCNCPMSFLNGTKCDCPARSIGNEYYWNGTDCSPAKSYNELCNIGNYTCKYLTENTICSGGICICQSLQYFDTAQQKCVNQLLNNQSCLLTTDCRIDLGLSCVSGKCLCNSLIQYWNGSSCVNLLTYNNGVCTSDDQCKGDLICRVSGTSCNCPSSVLINKCDCPTRSIGYEYYWNGTDCTPAKSYNELCNIANYTCKYLTENTICSGGICICQSLQYFDTTQKKCVNQLLNNQSCLLTTDCRIDLGLSCVSGKCLCNSLIQYWNGSSCVNLLTYNNGVCTSDDQCKGDLICRLNGTSCNCPSSVLTNKCDCPARSTGNEYYWNGTHCTPAKAYNESCNSGNYTCQYLTQLTQCDTSIGKCTCGPYGVWSKTSSKCLFCDKNWYLMRESCFRGSTGDFVYPMTPLLVYSYCYNDSRAIFGRLKVTDIGHQFLLSLSADPYYFFDAFEIGTSNVFQSSDKTVNLTYSASNSFWCSSLGIENCLVYLTGSDCIEDHTCFHTHSFICEYVLPV